VVRAQSVEKEIGCPRYLIGARGECAVRLRTETEKLLPLRQIIFLHSHNDILAWLLANHGQDPLDLLGVESGRKNREDRAPKREPAQGRYQDLNRNVWEDAVGIMQADADEDEDEEEVEWLEAESKGEPEAPSNVGAIALHDVSIDSYS